MESAWLLLWDSRDSENGDVQAETCGAIFKDAIFFLKEKKELNQSKVRKGNGNMDLEIHMFCFDSWLSFTAHQLGVGAEIGSSTRVVSQNCSAL